MDLGFGDSNQVDNGGDDEAIIFDLGSVHTPVEINLSLANNGGLFTDGDQYRIYGNNTGVFTSCTTGSDCLVGDLLATGTGAGSLQITNVGLPGSTPYRYIIAGLPGGSGDGYRVAQLSMETADIPLPPSIALLGVALAALGFGARRLSQNAS
ncbi:PEP-CTERM domain protein [Rhodovibrio salinarum]|uniref:PEP-CTERM domain protein n=1 Tax=Rhodovibrio salinarum TaxID=1087 RepID=A0A934QKN8_9PROT|nr:PEP-CTERM domain protein [Rhodovibrio salinarum]